MDLQAVITDALGRRREYRYRRLNRGEMRALESHDPWDRAYLAVGRASDCRPDEVPFGWVLQLADHILDASWPDPRPLLAAAEASLDDPTTIQEILITKAFPEYGFQVQREMSQEQWLEVWVYAQFVLTTLFGLDPDDLEVLLLGRAQAAQVRAAQAAEAQRRAFAAAAGEVAAGDPPPDLSDPRVQQEVLRQRMQLRAAQSRGAEGTSATDPAGERRLAAQQRALAAVGVRPPAAPPEAHGAGPEPGDDGGFGALLAVAGGYASDGQPPGGGDLPTRGRR